MCEVGDQLINEKLNQAASVVAVEELNGVRNVSLQPETGGRIVVPEGELENLGWIPAQPDTVEVPAETVEAASAELPPAPPAEPDFEPVE